MDDAVAPLAGAWIEILAGRRRLHQSPVAPLAGAWIEIEMVDDFDVDIEVAPLAGAWIEIFPHRQPFFQQMSLPSRERGLKYKID